jgi:hypothetical protein
MSGDKLPEVGRHGRSDDEVSKAVDARGNGASCVTLVSNVCHGNPSARMSGHDERSDGLFVERRQRPAGRVARVVVDDLDEVGPLGQSCRNECVGLARRRKRWDEMCPRAAIHLRRVAAWRRRARPCVEDGGHVRPIGSLELLDP